MAKAVGCFSLADVGSDLFTFDFANRLVAGDSIASASWVVTVADGADPDVGSIAIGSPTIFETKVTQKAAGFLPGVTYTMQANVVTNLGLTPNLWANITGETVGC